MKTKILKQAKRTLSLLLVLLMVVPMTVSFAVPVSAAEVKYAVEGGYIYFDPSTGVITDCDESVTKANIPSKINGVSVTNIGDFAFYKCSSLKSITIPNSVTSLGTYVFAGCSSLASVTIPDSVTSIGKNPFHECISFTSIKTEGDNNHYLYTDGVLFDIKKNELLYCHIGKEGGYTIPDGITSIAGCAFSYCTSLTSITIPEGVKSIGSAAFEYCSSLTSIIIPESVTSIDYNAFYGCTSLTSITVPDGVKSIDYATFAYCSSLTSIVIPESVTSIIAYAFHDCTSLEKIYYKGSKNKWKKINISDNAIPETVEIAYDYPCGVYGHSMGEWIVTTEPGCVIEGEETRTCDNCDAFETQAVPATGEHAYGEWTITTDANCNEVGEKKRYCIDCNATDIGVVETNDVHTWGVWTTATNPTCSLDGITTRICEKCGYVENKLTPSTGIHIYGEWVVTIEPTAIAKGEKSRKCVNCDATETEEIDKLEMTNPFTDVKEGQWYTEGILWCYHNEYMAGVSATEFGRKSNVTRAMFATILAKIDGSDISGYSKMSFTDVKPGQWYSNAIEWAASNGYAAGLGEGIFGYKQNVSREQIALFFYTYSSLNEIDVSAEADLSAYTDLDRVHSWALDAVEWAVAEGLISGMSETTLAPRESATRAEIALIVKNYVENVKSRP